ncbi:hypothetical protein DL93DRAFT_215175 [Clavulina sp. PMI_390]|nr:hypothetical protein DL93DRAFT_215175 [Clavulina sp. PMI_390]
MKYQDYEPDVVEGEDVDDAKDDITHQPWFEPTGRAWQRIFRYTIQKSSKLKTIKLRSTAGVLRSLLIPLRPFSRTSTPPDLSVPNLEELSLLVLPGGDPSISIIVAELLSSALTIREKMGSRLSLLEVTSCIADAMEPSFESFASSTRTVPCTCAEHWSLGDPVRRSNS